MEREFGLENVKPPKHNIYADLFSRPSSTPSVASRGDAIQAQDGLHGGECYICRQFGHCEEDCFKYVTSYKKTTSGGPSKRSSLHKNPAMSEHQRETSISRNTSRSKAHLEPSGALYPSLHPIHMTRPSFKRSRPAQATPTSPIIVSRTTLVQCQGTGFLKRIFVRGHHCYTGCPANWWGTG